ncbi:DUF4856 domain-containing protein [Aliifodinibius sp. S!AR15-10]|uniref:DUF4856 domain-containing protein n=1 Tax=Aliifodinibius sp. S!AR15-10 TaxID=2950437 RepID=UPI0028619986|nr:DUF4856 domain-containing protein [Aliifodinibius sp. S!AR15-10]MDR8392494.1 DUF4856 domain-containing protein [Aliifodinibius sp. S!AR15-10]
MAIAAVMLTIGCDTNNSTEETIDTPSTYEFSRDGESSVAYPGQTDRLKMLEEIDAYMGKGDDGELLSEQALLDMFENKDGNGGGNFSFTSDRQLKNKTFAPDLDANLFQDIFASAATASENGSNGITASNGTAGLIERENSGSTILVSANGREYGQLVEKGLMGAVFFNQIFNVYLTDDRIGPNVENEQLEEGANYTAKEHHFDEAFGYFGAPVDFSSDWPEERESEARFWADYSNGADDEFGMNDILMNAYISGRTAIVNKDQSALSEQVDILYENFELLAAATTVHYINSTLSHLDNGDLGEAFHTLSEAWAFANALKYSPQRKITLEQLEQIMETDFGENGNFWNVTNDGLNNAKSTLVNIYPELEPVQNQL